MVTVALVKRERSVLDGGTLKRSKRDLLSSLVPKLPPVVVFRKKVDFSTDSNYAIPYETTTGH